MDYVHKRLLNYCLGVTNGSALLRFSEGKISAVHGGDASEYAILEMPELFGAMAEYLESTFPGCYFAGAAYDHSIATAVWEIEQDSLIQTYKEALEAHDIPYSDLKPALRLTTSDVGVSGANIYPTLLSGGDAKIITLGMSSRVRRIRTRLGHKAGATLDKSKSNLPMIYARYTVRNRTQLYCAGELQKRNYMKKRYGELLPCPHCGRYSTFHIVE